VSAGDRALELRAAADVAGSAAPADRRAIVRIREHSYPTGRAAIGALVRGEASVAAHLPPDRVAEAAALPEVKVGKYAQPALHRIVLDGRNPALRQRALRRGLSVAIDRRALLEETVLRRAGDAANRVSDGPFPHGSYADAIDVKPLEYDPVLARMLVAAARKELGGDPIKLKLEYPAAPEPQAVVPRLVEAFGLAGVEVTAVERSESELEAELRADPLTAVASPRILQLLLQLERAPEWPTAKGLALQIDRECRDELPILPLWQVEVHYAWRTRLSGPGPETERLYQGIETWTIEPWFARDPW
jgi:peptide/nickel transport system substrate-binding protein